MITLIHYAKPSGSMKAYRSKLILGDCMDPVTGLASYPDNHFDLAFVDPPYGIGASRPAVKPDFAVQANGSRLPVKRANYTHKDWDDAPPPREYFDQLFRVSKQQIIWGCNYYDYDLRGGRLVWDKMNGVTNQYGVEIAYLSMTNRTDIVYYKWNGFIQGVKPSRDARIASKARGDKSTNEDRIHPTQKPAILCKWIIEEYCPDVETILDTGMGSGSVPAACNLLGIDCTAYEIDEEYYDLARQRIAGMQEHTLFHLR